MNIFTQVIGRFEKLRKNKSFRYGLPFLLFLFAGSFGIERFASLRYEFRRTKTLDPKDLEKLGKKKVALEEMFEEYKKLDIDSWENIRGPRPWEEPQQAPAQKL